MKISEALTDRDEDHEGDNADDRPTTTVMVTTITIVTERR